MKKIIDFQHKNVLVLGLAKSGFAAAKLLKKLGANVTVNEKKNVENDPIVQQLKSLNIAVIGGGHPLHLLDQHFDFIVKNPGIPYSNPLVQKAQKNNIPIITEVEIAYRIAEADIIGITGSNGKTTTTTLIYEILKEAHKNPLISGNIGTVACEVAEQATDHNTLVMELSSFQLMGIQQFRPKIAVLLNIFQAHLDYHGTLEAYKQAKANIFKNQLATDYTVVNVDDPLVTNLAQQTNATVVPFSQKKIVHNGAYVIENKLFYKNEHIINIKDIALPGEHNIENILAAICVSKLCGVATTSIQKVLQTFKGVKHRLQYVDTIHGRKFYNDSKATNILAAQKAIAAFTDPIILLAGGLDRGNDFDAFIPYLKKVKGVITFGETAEKIMNAAKKVGMKLLKRVDTLENAIKEAYKHSDQGDVILLSPACASWDQFQTFEQRGDMFIESVHKLKVDEYNIE